MRYNWEDLEKEGYNYYRNWDGFKNKQFLNLGAAFGPRRIKLPLIRSLWLKQTIGAIILAILIFSLLSWDSPTLAGLQQGLRYLVAVEHSDFTPVLETFVREGLWLDPYERQVFKDITKSEDEEKELMSIPVSGRFARKFGWVESSVSGKKTFHSGIDIETEVAAPVRAALSGTVLKVDYTDDLGRIVIIDHGNGLTTLYGTLAEVLVEENEKVHQGEIIGKAGTLRNTNRGQLHFEVRENNKAVDPLKKISNVKTSI